MALNKLLGREVYSSNSQLGGVQVRIQMQIMLCCTYLTVFYLFNSLFYGEYEIH